MKEQLKKKVSHALENLASDIATQTGCAFLWGEVEVPECLRQENEDDVENEEGL